MTEIQKHDPATPAVVTTPPSPGVDMIARTAGQLGQAYQIAEALCSTTFAPSHFRGKPQEAAAAILFGSQIGLDPLASMQNIYVIGGKPALYARTMSAVVQAAGHSIWTEETTDQAVTVAGQRRGSEAIERVTWTIDRAQKAGYTSNANYQKDPQAMLYARAVGDVARRIAPDALLGLAYTVEEMRVSAGAQDAQRTAPGRRHRRQEAPQEPTTEPSGRNWADELLDCGTAQEVRDLWEAAHSAGELTPELKADFTAAGITLSQNESTTGTVDAELIDADGVIQEGA